MHYVLNFLMLGINTEQDSNKKSNNLLLRNYYEVSNTSN